MRNFTITFSIFLIFSLLSHTSFAGKCFRQVLYNGFRAEQYSNKEYLVYDKNNPDFGILGTLGDDGMLEVIMQTKKTSTAAKELRTSVLPSGSTLFQKMLNHFGEQINTVEGIKATWDITDDLVRDNINRLNTLTAHGVSIENAAKDTWLGKQARTSRFGEVNVVSTEGTRGKYTKVTVEFRPTPKLTGLEEFNSQYREFDFPKVHTIMRGEMRPLEGSLAVKNPELINKLDTLDDNLISLESFRNRYRNIYKKEANTFAMRSFFYNRFNLFKFQTNQWLGELKKISPELYLSARNRINDATFEINESFNQFAPKTPEARAYPYIEHASNMMYGLNGELRALVTLPKIDAFSKRLLDMPEIKNELSQKINKMRVVFREEPDLFLSYEMQYPEIFNSRAINNQGYLTNDEKLQYVEKWILSKEIDFIRHEDGITKWIEFKNNPRPFIDDEHFDRALIQMNQDKEIVDFLGVGDKVKIEFMPRGGIEDDAAKRLRNIGVKVVTP